MSAGKRQNTVTYLEKLIGNGLTINGRNYSSNGIIKRTVVTAQGDVYKCGERVNKLAAGGEVKADIGVLASYSVQSGTGHYDGINMTFEELLAKNKDGFAVYSNLKGGSSSIPLKYNTEYNMSSASLYEKESYRYSWDHGLIYKYVDSQNAEISAPTIAVGSGVPPGDVSEITDWTLNAGWDDIGEEYMDIREFLVDSDNKIRLAKNGGSIGKDYKYVLDTRNSDKSAQAKFPDTKTYYSPDITVTQTIYTQDDNIVRNIIQANGRLVAPRQTDRRFYETFGLGAGENQYWLHFVESITKQSSIYKIQCAFKYRKYEWSTDIYQAYQNIYDPFTLKATTAAQPPVYT